MMQEDSKKTVGYRAKFAELAEESLDKQAEFFLKSFIFALGEDWKSVTELTAKFQKYLGEQNEKKDLDPVQAADFLQKNGKTRTAMQRKEELADIDLDKNGRIGLTEYLILHFKVMILSEYFKRHETTPNVSLENDGIGLTGVGDMLLEELFTVKLGMDPELERAIEEFMAKKREKETKVKDLEAKTVLGGVKGLTAKAELAQIAAGDKTDENRIEITLNAAKKRAGNFSAAEQLKKTQEQEAARTTEKRRASKANLAQRAAMFEKGIKTA